MTRVKYGDRAACAVCGQDIVWLGRATGWTDRGSGTQCLPYKGKDGEIVRPWGKKHRPYRESTS